MDQGRPILHNNNSILAKIVNNELEGMVERCATCSGIGFTFCGGVCKPVKGKARAHGRAAGAGHVVPGWEHVLL